jgi:hypothetical protein
MTDKWLTAINEGQMVGSVFIDLSKAFDSISHERLLKKLAMYGCASEAIAWFSSYLGDRSQIVHFKGTPSETEAISRGVPQGSILGPLLFIVFVNDLPMNLSDCETDLYADDTTVYVVGKSVHDIEVKLEHNMLVVAQWCQCNDLQINVNKTDCMLITTRQKRCHLEGATMSVNLNEEVIPVCCNQKVLGINQIKTLTGIAKL